MSFNYNIASFRSIRHAHGVGLLVKCYAACVHLELALKSDPQLQNHAGNSGHDLPQMLNQVSGNTRTKNLLISLSRQLANKLQALHCQSKTHAATQVRANNYPHMRYLRHAADWSASQPSSTDPDLLSLLSLLDQIMATLRPPNTRLPL